MPLGEDTKRDAMMERVRSALAKKQRGQPDTITAAERRALKAFEAEQDRVRGLRFVAALPKKLYAEWAGRQQKTLNEQADLYGVPLRGTTINVPHVVRWLHDWLAEHKHDLAHLRGGPKKNLSPKEQLVLEQIEVYRRRVVLLEQRIAREETLLVPRAEVHELHVQLAKILRQAGERLLKQYGEGAVGILDAALDDFEHHLAALQAPAAK